MSLLVDSNGKVIHSEVHGQIHMNCKLTGMPEVKLGINDKQLFDLTGKRTRSRTITLDDMKFHQCVKLNRFDSERLILFIPPDGEFDLMT